MPVEDDDRDRLVDMLHDAYRLADRLGEGMVTYMLQCALMELQQRRNDPTATPDG